MANDPRFNTVDVQWDFIVISSEVRGTPQYEAGVGEHAVRQILHTKDIRVWVYTWAEVIEAANHRLKFVRDQLGYSPNAQQALAYLRATHEKYLPSQLRDGAA